jgi:nucleotide-binding universal stress UspA family protein
MSTIVVGYTPAPQSRAAPSRSIEQMAVVNALLDSAGIEHEIRQPVRGHDGGEEVLRAAEELDADLIVGVRRRTAVGELLPGSTAATIIMQAPCDVLAVKP